MPVNYLSCCIFESEEEVRVEVIAHEGDVQVPRVKPRTTRFASTDNFHWVLDGFLDFFHWSSVEICSLGTPAYVHKPSYHPRNVLRGGRAGVHKVLAQMAVEFLARPKR